MSATAGSLPGAQDFSRPDVNPWLIGITVSMAAFIEVLDTSVANVALPYIAGDLGASYDDSTWVLTSYLAANAIVLPVSGWLAEVIGRKRYFMSLAHRFHGKFAALWLCAESADYCSCFEHCKGVGGGGLQPMAQAILNDTFPPEQRGRRLRSTVLLPSLPRRSARCWGDGSPTTIPGAGYFSSRCPWPCSLFTSPHPGRRIRRSASVEEGGIRVDYMGLSMLALGVGSLQIVLDKGQEDDWFGSHFHHDPGDHRGGLPDLAGHLGMVPQRADHRCPHVQELQLRSSEPDDVHDGLHALQHLWS